MIMMELNSTDGSVFFHENFRSNNLIAEIAVILIIERKNTADINDLSRSLTVTTTDTFNDLF